MDYFKPFVRIQYALLILMLLVVFGIFGFVVIEDYSWNEAFYMTMLTISTVGFNEVRPLSEDGRIFTSILIIFSFGTFAYAISAITSYFVNGEFRKYFKSYRMSTEIKNMTGHVIVCGFGRNGSQAVSDLRAHGKKIIIVEKELGKSGNLSEYSDCILIDGDATNDDVLNKANPSNAAALITTLPSDAENLFVVLTARELNKDMTIIARASDDGSDKKLRRAGADNVIMPDKVGGAHMASLVVKPDVVEFMDYIIGQGSSMFHLEEITFEDLPEQYKNKTIRELEIRQKTGANIVGFKTGEGEYLVNPSADEQVNSNDKLFVLGTNEQLEKLKEAFAN